VDRDERTIYLALVLIGILPIAGAIATGGPVGAGVTICFLMVLFGLVGLFGEWRRHQVPRAQIARRTRSR
jgi:hypothetical protein